jgi:PEP-CTERM motif
LYTSFFARNMCVVVLGLFGAAGFLAGATVMPQTTFTGTITLDNAQFDNYFVYDANSGAISGSKSLGPVTAGTYPVTESVDQYIGSGVATALGLVSSSAAACMADSAACHVAVAVNRSLFNSTLGTLGWDQVFSGTSESSIATALKNGDGAALTSFLNQYSSDFVNFSSNTSGSMSAGILTFSTATAGGSLTFSNIAAVGDPTAATPEPSTNLLLGVGLGALGLLARKFRKT